MRHLIDWFKFRSSGALLPKKACAREWDALAARAHPRISVEQHRAAVARIQAEQAKVVEFVLPNGELVRLAAGAIDIRDIMHAQGYSFVVIGYDSFGWPMGHPDSPRATM